MAEAHGPQTRATLLRRLATAGDPDQAAWAEFVELYGDLIYRWCLAWGLQEADARDVTQRVLLKLAARMKTFAYDPAQRFRSWLRAVAKSALCDFEADRSRQLEASTECGGINHLLRLEARSDLEERIEAEYERELFEEALRRVRLRVAPHTWEAFRLTALEGVRAAEVAQQLHMRVGTVYEARSSVVKKLQEERAALEGEEERA